MQIVPKETIYAVVAGFAISLPMTARSDEPAPSADRRPNIIFVLVDDLRWDELGCMGHPYVNSQHIDRVANEGALFLNAFCTTPLCSPSRASFLTGRYPHSHGIIDNTDRSQRSHDLITFPLLLQRVGYETAFVGKWHMGNDDTPRPGFDHWLCMKGQGETIDPEFNENGKQIKLNGYVTDILTDYCVQLITRHHSKSSLVKKPLCIVVSHKALHPNSKQFDDGSTQKIGPGGSIPAERHKQLYEGVSIPRRPNCLDTLVGKPVLQRSVDGQTPFSKSTATSAKTILDRQRMLAAVDDGLGAIFKALSEIDALDQTLIVVTSDHGFFYGEHCLGTQRRLAYEEGIRIPLLLRYPPLIPSPTSIEFTALSLDLAPTLLELAGAKIPDNLHGCSLVPVLRGDTMPARQSFLVEYFSDRVYPRIRNMGYQAVRTDSWKYIHYTELKGMDELYDLKSDPYEMNNIIADPNSTVSLANVKTELSRLLRATELKQ